MRRLLMLTLTTLAAFPFAASAAPVTLFQNNFEAPTGIVIPTGCCGDAT